MSHLASYPTPKFVGQSFGQPDLHLCPLQGEPLSLKERGRQGVSSSAPPKAGSSEHMWVPDMYLVITGDPKIKVDKQKKIYKLFCSVKIDFLRCDRKITCPQDPFTVNP